MPVPDLAPALGAHPSPDGTTFALAAAHAQRVELCLFGEVDEQEDVTERRVLLEPGLHGVWSATVPGVGPGRRYGYRVHGPWQPERGHRHNPAKLLLDPYGRGVDGTVTWNPAVHGHHVSDDAPSADVTVRDDRDSAPYMPRSVVVDTDFDWGTSERDIEHRRVPWSRTVLYETHVAGATRRHPEIPAHLRGTYAGLAHPAFLDHVTALGVTTIELLPVHAFTHEQHLATTGRTNYWGYNTLGFFAPHQPYAAEGSDPLREFKSMVAAFHARGLEVVLDVVYNHTAEQDRSGPTLSWRGVDNTAYYRLDAHGSDVDMTGCGNSLDLSQPTCLRMVLDSLRYWVEECHVDGFRFDLAVTLGRSRDGSYDRDHPFLLALRTDPVLSRVKLIAEPWDVGPDGWRTGAFPAPLAEWNDRFRDSVRSFWLSDLAPNGTGEHGTREIATRLAGSEDLFGGPDARGPIASINYVASHDGFSLADTCAYDEKHNEANGEDNRDGHGDNRSHNHGVEGPTDDVDVLRRRRRSLRNLLATTILATGVPMLTAGDEFGRTQQGNNNAYCQDNEVSWLDWEHAPWQQDVLDTTRFLLAVRAEHPVLRQRDFFRPGIRPGDGRVDLLWYDRDGTEMTTPMWDDPTRRVLQQFLVGTDVDATSMLVVHAGTHEDVDVTLPDLINTRHGFELLWDSAWERPAGTGAADAAPTPALSGGSVVRVGAASIQLYRLV